jgi:hypothetical protein
MNFKLATILLFQNIDNKIFDMNKYLINKKMLI